jgi:uncharacterized protein (TIGR03643 family)
MNALERNFETTNFIFTGLITLASLRPYKHPPFSPSPQQRPQGHPAKSKLLAVSKWLHDYRLRISRKRVCLFMDDQVRDKIIRMAWEDRTTFEDIKKQTGLTEVEVIKVMRRNLKPSSFRMWRKRVSGRMTKHASLFKQSRQEMKRGWLSRSESRQ